MSILVKTCHNCKKVFHTEQEYLKNTSQWRVCSSEHLWFNCNCGSTHMIPKGKYPWYTPTLNMSDEAGSLFNKIAIFKELPHIPSVVMQIQQLLQSSEIETSHLVREVRQDPILAAEILKFAENLKNFRNPDQKPIQSLEHAINYIGRKNLDNLVLAASIKSFILPTKIFDVEAFWQHAFLTGAVAEFLGNKFGEDKLEKDKLYLAGTLCNIGKIISALCFPDEIDQVQSYVNDLKTMTSWEKAERATKAVSHSILGEIGAALWGFPVFILDAARFHHRSINLRSAKKIDAINMIGFANILSHWILLEPHRIDNEKLKNFSSLYHLNEKGLEDLMEELKQLHKTVLV